LSSETKDGAKSGKRTWLRAVLLAIPLVMLVWVGWNFRPWMAEGHAVYLGDAHFGNYDFQVWQRKMVLLMLRSHLQLPCSFVKQVVRGRLTW